MRRIRLFGLTIVAALALSVAAASAASAHEFKSTKAEYPVTVKAHSTSAQTFEAAGFKSVCKSGSFSTGEENAPNPNGPSETLLIHPKYTECHVTIATEFPAKVVTTGCNYKFHAAAPSTTEGSVDVECATGKKINIELEGLAGCVISVGTQAGLKTVEYKNEAGKVAVNANVTKIKWEATSACGLGIGGTEAVYKGSAQSEGFNGLGEADLIEVV